MRDFIITTYSELVIIHYQLFSASHLWNIAPENRWLQDDCFLWDGATWQVRTVSFKGCRYSGSAHMAPLLAVPSWWPVDHESCITHGHLAAGSFCYVYTIHQPRLKYSTFGRPHKVQLFFFWNMFWFVLRSESRSIVVVLCTWATYVIQYTFKLIHLLCS